ncbi:Nucleic acid-binding proteins superfamily [Striga hermonthica]|uniref:Nucleic acid-binding proteins superfamily n=1 Tax=Striga hermonthica TaxID=68872 RepID=A0A9N7RPS6_STRHE|nr:Nucleic acid-binding proteins superfamily [Striga hermonthica]
MHLLTAPSVAGGFSFLANFSNSVSASEIPLIGTPLNLSCSLPSNKRPASLSALKVSVSSGSSTTTVDGLDQSLRLEDARRARTLADWKSVVSLLHEGSVVQGKVEGYNNGGLVIRIYSLWGFLPYLQLSPSHSCKEPHKTFTEIARSLVGSLIPLKVIKADEVNQQLIFSEKEANWSIFYPQLEIGDIFHARVGSVDKFGAFLRLRFPDGLYHLSGRVHVSEVSWDLVQDVRDVLAVGDEVRAKIVHIDRKKPLIKLSIKQLFEDPLRETFDKVIPQDISAVPDALDESALVTIEPLPGLDTIIEELLKEDGIDGVKISGQRCEKSVLSQDLQLWLTNALPSGGQYTLLARAGSQVLELQLTTYLDLDGIKSALEQVLKRVP